MKIIFITLLVFAVTACSTKVSDKIDTTARQLAADTQASCAKNECPCDSPVGTIKHGSNLATYKKDTVACTQACGGDNQVSLTCKNGKFFKNDKEQSLVGLNFKCVVPECNSCILGENIIPAGTSVTVYRKSTLDCGESPEDFKQIRTCNANGLLTGDAIYQFFSMTPKLCRCELPDNTGFISLGGSATFYSKSVAACGERCVDLAQNRKCNRATGNDGSDIFSFDGSSSYRYRACQEASNCYCTLPNNLGILYHGQTKDISSVETAACGERCTDKPKVTVKCDNGLLKSLVSPFPVIDFNSAQYNSFKYNCSQASCTGCPVPGTSISVTHGETYRFAKNNSVGCSETCSYLERTCSNGTFLGNSEYSSPSCERRSCSCQVPGNTGVEIPVGSTWNFYRTPSAQCGQTCAQISQAKTCTEIPGTNNSYTYDFQGSPYSFPSCVEATNCSCALPNSLGTIENEKSVILTSQSSVACNTTCDQIPSITLTCRNGGFVNSADGSSVDTSNANFQFKYYCNQATCSDCSLPGYGTIPVGRTFTLYSKNSMGCGEQPELFTFSFSCQNGTLTRNGSAYDPANDSSAPSQWFTNYTYNCPGCTLPWGGSIAEGTSINAYKTSGRIVSGCGSGCKVQQRKCTNGSLDGDISFNLQSCNNNCTQVGGGAPPRMCLLPWQNTFITTDAQISVFNKRTVGCGDSCALHYKLARCKMETGTFDVPLDYIYPSCSKVCP